MELTEENVEGFLHSLLERISSDDIPSDTSKLCSDLVTSLSLCSKLASVVGEILAALACEESFRDEARNANIISSITPFLTSPDVRTRLQILRAIGNLSIDNDANRESILVAGGCQVLVDQIARCSDPGEDIYTNERYKCIICGCVLNLATNNEKLTQEFLIRGTIEGISSMLSIQDQPESVVGYGLQALCVLTETADLSMKDPTFFCTVIHLLSRSNKKCEYGYLKNLLELIKIIIEKGDETASLKLIDCGVVQQLLELNSTEYQQQSIDLIVLLLGKDKCMEKLFEDKEVLSIAKRWLGDQASQLHRANAALIVANMARSDSNCLVLMQNGFVPLLISLVKVEESEEMMGKLHHAALSALRNLSLPTVHKEAMFSMGVIDVAIYALKTSTMAHVHFKAIGIMRLLVDNQALTCSYVVNEALEQICEVCVESSVPHIHIETGRLLSSVVKYCQDESTILKIKMRGLEWIYHLLECEQVQLVNEGLIAMNIIIALLKDEVPSLFEKFSIIDRLCSILTSSFPLNLIINSLILIKTSLSKESNIKDMLKDHHELKAALQKLASHDNQEIQLKANELLTNIEFSNPLFDVIL